MKFLLVPKEGALGFLTNLSKCGAGRGRAWKLSAFQHQKRSQTVLQAKTSFSRDLASSSLILGEWLSEQLEGLLDLAMIITLHDLSSADPVTALLLSRDRIRHFSWFRVLDYWEQRVVCGKRRESGIERPQMQGYCFLLLRAFSCLSGLHPSPVLPWELLSSELIWANSQWSHLLEDLKPCFTTQDGEFELSLPEILVLIMPKLCNKGGRTAG